MTCSGSWVEGRKVLEWTGNPGPGAFAGEVSTPIEAGFFESQYELHTVQVYYLGGRANSSFGRAGPLRKQRTRSFLCVNTIGTGWHIMANGGSIGDISGDGWINLFAI